MDTSVSVESVSESARKNDPQYIPQSDLELKPALCCEKLVSVRSSKRMNARPHMPQEHGVRACSQKIIHSRMRNYRPPPRKLSLLRMRHMRMCKI
jgi:hypothetical protein